MKPYILIVIILLILISAFIFYYYTINIYEVIYEVEPADLFADNQSIVKIEAVPLNALGFRAIGRSAPAEFDIVEGDAIITIIKKDTQKGILILQGRDISGQVTIRIKSKYALLPSEVKVMVYTNAA
jgi:hypothetical protein